MPIEDLLEATIKTAIDDATDDGGIDEPVVDTPAEPDESGGVDEPVVVERPAEPVVEPVVEKPAVDEFAKEHGIQPKRKDGRENSIPYSRTVKISENAVKKARTAWEAEQAPVVAKVTAYEERLARIGETESIMFGEPERFLQILATSVPGYAKLLARQAAEPEKRAADTVSDEPGPDVDMGNGQVGYSPAGLAKLRAWDREQAVKLAEERLSKRYEPLEKAFTSHQADTQQIQHVNAQLDEGARWPGFKENADAILKALQDDYAANPRAPKLRNLRDAYDSVVFPKFKTDEAALEARLRTKILDELKKAPRSTSAGHSVAGSVADREVDGGSSGDPVEDAIRRSIKGLK